MLNAVSFGTCTVLLKKQHKLMGSQCRGASSIDNSYRPNWIYKFCFTVSKLRSWASSRTMTLYRLSSLSSRNSLNRQPSVMYLITVSMKQKKQKMAIIFLQRHLLFMDKVKFTA